VERSLAKALLRGVLALPLGIILGFIFEFVANMIYNLGLGICAQMGVLSIHNHNPLSGRSPLEPA